jgi:tRNA dimethylallyltransferase
VPILVGGTGLYVQAIVENMEIPEVPPDPAYRAFLERKGKAWILSRLEKLDPAYAARIGPNPRYAARALEVIRATGRPFGGQQGKGKPLFEALLLGLDPGKAALRRRIARRVGAMFRAGLVGEVRRLAGRYGWDVPAMSGIGYRELKPLLEGTIGAREAEKTLVKRTSLYAKRQMTWWRRMKGIRWFTDPKQALREAISWLNTAKKRT